MVPAVTRVVLMNDHQALFEGEESGTLPQTDPGDSVQIQYTSGTTGLPKGALLLHHGLLRNATDILGRMRVEAGDVYLHNMPLFHTTGCAILVLGTLARGGTLLLAPLFDPAMLIGVIERERPDFLLGVPTMVSALIEAAAGRTMPKGKGIMSGGAMVSPELVRKAQAVFGVPIQIVYGQTECSPGITTACALRTSSGETIAPPDMMPLTFGIVRPAAASISAETMVGTPSRKSGRSRSITPISIAGSNRGASSRVPPRASVPRTRIAQPVEWQSGMLCK